MVYVCFRVLVCCGMRPCCVCVCACACVCYDMYVLWCVWMRLHHVHSSFSLDLIRIPNPQHWFISCLEDTSVVKVSNYEQFIQ